MITIENINSKTAERTKEQLKNKRKHYSIADDDLKHIMDHLHDTLDFGCNESIYTGQDRYNLLDDIRNIINTRVDSRDIEVNITVNDTTNTFKPLEIETDLKGLLEILGLYIRD